MSEDVEVEVEVETGNPPVPENDPTEYIPVMRHHLHEALLALGRARDKQAAEDLADAYRDGQGVWRESALQTYLARSAYRLEGYLGLLDEEDGDEQESVSEVE
jgi:hypothetical protein